MLPDDCATTETLISYPMSTESLGRGIELLQSGMNVFILHFANMANFFGN